MNAYDAKRIIHCPKCGHLALPGVSYEQTSHDGCLVAHEHLHGWCKHCQYDGPEYIFTVKEATKRP